MRLRYTKLSVNTLLVIIGALLIFAIGVSVISSTHAHRRFRVLSPAEWRKQALKDFRKQWGRVPEPGELFDIRRPLSIALSANGEYLAIDMLAPSSEWVGIWSVKPLRLGILNARIYQIFTIDASREMQWHPTRSLIVAATESNGYQLLNLHTRKSSYITGFHIGDLTWSDNRDEIIAYMRDSVDLPGYMARINIWTGQSKPFDISWLKEDTGKLSMSRYGDFAAEIEQGNKITGIVLYTKSPMRGKWVKSGIVRPISDPTLKKTLARPKLLNWMLDGRLVYAMIYPGDTSGSIKNVELWTCRKDGSVQKKWLTVQDAEPSSYYKWGQWLSVSANGKRVAFFRKDKVFVFDTRKLARSQRKTSDH